MKQRRMLDANVGIIGLGLIVLLNLVHCFEFSDLQNLDGSCAIRGTCQRRRGNRLDLELDWRETNCFCDDSCIQYGDCCLEAKTYDKVRMKTAHLDYECVEVEPFGNFYMKDDCKESWSSTEFFELCRQASISSEYNSDPFLTMPVTSKTTDGTYKNYYCALCNDEQMENIEVWSAQLSCPDSYELGEEFIEKNIKYVNGSWGLFMNSSDGHIKFSTCYIFPSVKETVVHKIRQCMNYISTCSANWTDSNVHDLCLSYTTIVYGPASESVNFEESSPAFGYRPYSSVAYRNYHCAICNFVNNTELACHERNFRESSPAEPVSFSVLFDFGNKNTNCSRGEIWDPFSKRCRIVVCLEQNHEFRAGRCIKMYENVLSTTSEETLFETEESDNSTETEDNFKDNLKMKCDKLFLNESDFTRAENGTIKVNIFRRTYEEDEYQVYKEGILVCIPNSYSRLMGWLTLFGLGLSCLCIVIHLLAFFLVSDLRNLSGKNLASMCLALLIAYTCFLITSFKEHGTNNCSLIAAAMYYFFLASFSWMNVMAFDIWRTLQKATSELRVTSGKQWKKFTCYSIYAWLLPFVALVLVIALDYMKPKWIHPSYLPELGKRLCWFGQRKAILVYFAAPLAAIMTLNMFFFIMAVRMVALTANSTSAISCSQSHQVQLKLYLRLALLMGLSWISGIVAGYIQEEYMWYLFILLNAFQGLFILVAFTCTKKVFRALKSTRSFRSSYKRSQGKNYTSRQVLESQDSNHSNLSNTSTTTLNSSSVTSVTSKSPITYKIEDNSK